MKALSPTGRFLRAAVAILVGLTVLAGWSYVRFSASRDAAGKSAVELADCRSMAHHIDALKQRPSIAGSQSLQASELAQRMEQASKTASMPPMAVVRIAPGAPRRIGESSYKEEPTEILLQQVTLHQLIVFLHSVTGESSDMTVTSLRLTAPRDADLGERWTVEATLSHIVYAPKIDDSARRL